MISFFNKLGNTWVAKVIFVILLISMTAFFGLGGLSNIRSSDKTAIQVGSKKISMSEVMREFDLQRTQLSQLMGQYISPQQALELGLLQKTIQKQVSDAILEEIQENLGLTASDAAVRKYVERHPAFQDNLNQFDRNLFLAYLNQTHTTETQLAEQLRNELAEQHLKNTIRFVTPAPKLLAELQWKKQNEIRSIEALYIKQDDIQISQQPTESDLKDYYEAYLSDFMQPEQRDIIVVTLTPDLIAQNIKISQEQLNEIYEEEKETYAIPEKRRIYQIRFSDKNKAEQVLAELTPQNFMAKAMAQGQTAEETDFGFVTRTEMLEELADNAFSAKEKTIIGPIESAIGWHLILVDSIQPATHPNKDQIYTKIKQKLAASLAYEQMEQVSRTLEDLLGEGKTLSETAQQLKLPTHSLKKVDITGTNIPKELKNQELLQDVFTLKTGETTALINHQNGFVVAEVQKIQPAEPKAFDLVKAEVKKLWLQDQQKATLPTLTEQALTQMQQGNIPARLGQLIVTNKLTLKGDSQVPDAALPSIFMQSIGYKNAQAITLPDGSFINVVKVVKQPLMKPSEESDQAELVASQLATDIYDAIVATYAEQLGIQIHTDLIQNVFSIYQNEQ